MKIIVENKTIEIPDEIAERFEKCIGIKVDAEDVLMYIGSYCEAKDACEYVRTHSVKEITNVTIHGMTRELQVADHE